MLDTNNSLYRSARSKTFAKRLVKAVSLNDAERAIKNLQAACAELKARELNKSLRQRAANVKKVRKLMAQTGLTLRDLESSAAGSSRRSSRNSTRSRTAAASTLKGRKIPPKYRINVDGSCYEWSGRGRMPRAFRERIENGDSLENHLID